MIKDIRAVPYPADFPVIQQPGIFTGWAITVELPEGTYSVVINRTDSREDLIARLGSLADEMDLYIPEAEK